MTAWDQLLAASTLTSGSAWTILGSPRTGGAGVVMNDGIEVALGANDVTVLVPMDPIVAEVEPAVSVEISSDPIVVEVAEV